MFTATEIIEILTEEHGYDEDYVLAHMTGIDTNRVYDDAEVNAAVEMFTLIAEATAGTDDLSPIQWTITSSQIS